MKFRSGFEKRIYESAKRRRKQIDYEPKDSHLAYSTPRKYIPDFRLPNGILVEAKGRLTSADRSKMLRVLAENPRVEIRFLFQRASNRLTKSKNSITYGEWATKHGFIWHEGDTIPTAWWNE